MQKKRVRLMVKFTIPGELPALNEMINSAKNRYGQYIYTAMKKRVERTIAISLVNHKVPVIKTKIDVSITWVCKNKRKDKDNIICIGHGRVEALKQLHKEGKTDDIVEVIMREDLTDEQIEDVFATVAKEENLALVNRIGDIDYPSKIGWVLLKKEPKLLKYAGKFLRYGLRGR